jgi:xanthine dehydrogenase molybdenum-binding subunit
MTLSVISQSVVRRDLREKLTGEARYSADLKLPGMLYGQVLRSPHPHANILSVDTSRASQLPGVYAIVTPFDAPPGRVALDLLILDTRVRFVGDEVAAVAAVDPDVARHALDLIQIEYEVLSFSREPEEALKPDAIAIHPQGNLAIERPLSLERGDVAQGFAEADLVFEEEYDIPTHSATPLEPRAALASWEGEGEGDSLTVWKSSRGVHVDRAALAGALDIPQEKIRVVGPYLGAGYGNKDESRMAALAAVLARRAGRPVRIEYSRQEEFVAGRTRHAARIRLKVGVKRDGTVTAIHGIATFNAGAYQASTPGVARRAGQGMLYLYRCPNVKYQAYPAYTNCPVAGSYRALGAPQGHFALETLIDRLAEALGLDPLEFRLKNQVPPKDSRAAAPRRWTRLLTASPWKGAFPFPAMGWTNACAGGLKLSDGASLMHPQFPATRQESGAGA